MSDGNGLDHAGLLAVERSRIDHLEQSSDSRDRQLSRNTASIDAMTKAIAGLAGVISNLDTRIHDLQKLIVERDLNAASKSYNEKTVIAVAPTRRKALSKK